MMRFPLGGGLVLSRKVSNLLRVLGFLLGGTCAVVLALALLAWARFDGGAAASAIEQYAITAYQRNLVMAAAPRLTLWPRPELLLQRVTLSEAGRIDIFAHVQQVRLRLGFWALLAGRLEIRGMVIDNASLAVLRERDGRWNIANLLTAPAPADPPAWQMALETTELRQLKLRVIDRRDASEALLQGLDARLHRPAGNTAAALEWQATWRSAAGEVLQLAGEAQVNLARSLDAAQLEQLQLQFRGEAGGLAGISGKLRIRGLGWSERGRQGRIDALSLEGSGAQAQARHEWSLQLPELTWQDRRIGGKGLWARISHRDPTQSGQLELVLPDLLATAQGFSVSAGRLSGDYQQGALTAAGKLDLAFEARLDEEHGLLKALSGELLLRHPALREGRTRLSLEGQGDWRRVRGAELALTLGQQQQNLDLQLALHRLQPLQARAELRGEDLDIDSLFRPDSLRSLLALPLAAELTLAARVTLADLQLGSLQWRKLQFPLLLENGRMSITGLTGALYDGQFKADLNLDAGKRQFDTHGEFSSINLGALRADSAWHVPLAGRASGSFRLNGSADSAQSLLAGAEGAVRWRLQPGELQAVDIAHSLREFAPAVAAGSGSARSPQTSEQTRFNDISARFVIGEGRWRTDNLQARNAWLAVEGKGEGSLLDADIDLLLRASLLPGVARGDTRDLAALRGKPLPLRLKGPILQPDIRYDLPLRP